MAKFLVQLVQLVLAAAVVECVSPGQARSAGVSTMRHTLPYPPPLGTACDFERPCSWQWKNNTTPPGFNVVSGKQVEKSFNTLPRGEFTGPIVDANNSSEGHFLFVMITEGHPSSQREVHLTSPKYESTGEHECHLDMAVAMGRMAGGNFKVVIETVNRTSWVVTEKPCNERNMWEHHSVGLGRISQQFHVIIEVSPGRKTPAYFAVDNLRFVDCFPETPPQRDCTGLQFRCSNKVCIDRSRVCDIHRDCISGEDEEQDCDKVPPFSRCSFEDGWCGWHNVMGKELNWTRHSGKTPTNLTGPSYDHTLQNAAGMYMFVDMSKSKHIKHLGAIAVMESVVFNPPPRYHGNISSAYYNSCQIRFHYHMFGPHSGSLTLFLVHLQSQQRVAEGKWYSFGDRGDKWYREVVTLPNITYRFAIQFEGRRGYASKGDIAVDDFSLSPECFGIGVPPNETMGYNYYGFKEVSATPTDEHEDFTNETYYQFNTCGQTGPTGPTPELCAKAYAGSNINVTVLQEPPMAGVQKWVVPQTGFYTIIAKGAGGGQGSSEQGISRGATVRAVKELFMGESIYMLVGQAGSNAACSKDGTSVRRCQPITKPSTIRDAVREVRNLSVVGGGGGGGGATYIFTVNTRRQRIPLMVAGGGGGLSNGPHDVAAAQLQDGQGFNASRGNSSGAEFGSSPAGAGGGWEEPQGPRRASRGTSLLEGAFGGEPCVSSNIIGPGGFGGGGGGCTAGGGGGGYAGGDAWSERRRSGQGGTSMVREVNTELTHAMQGTHDGAGFVIIIPSLDNGACGCDYRCVALDEYRHHTRCLCPDGWSLGNDSTTCVVPNKPSVSHTGYLLVFGSMSVAVFLCVGTICMVLYARYLRKKKELTRRRMLTGPDLQLNRLRVASGGMMTEYNPNYEFGGGTYTIQDLKEIPRDQLRLVKALGQGAFGEVYQGFYKTRAGDAVEMPVAVKTLPELSSNQAEMDFLMEALIMSKFSHPNIVHFIGVCFGNHPKFIVLELLAGGDLKTFLREARPKPQDHPGALTMKDLLLCTIDVAKGCKYMEDNHFIHRDIAARNCLLTTKGPGRVVKIADFGMARDIYRADYYRKGGKAMLPVKWMPPEAFLDGIFTSKTDVWSFGVLMWEVFSLGYMPYTGRGNQEVMTLVTNGGRLESPLNCPAPVYGIMTQCWQPTPDDRPTFGTILERIGYCLQDPDVLRASLPIFYRPPSTERDATIMRPPAHDASCLLVPRGQASAVADYLVPLQGLGGVEMHSSPSGGSAEHLLSAGAYLGDNSWETSFVRDGGEEEEEEDDELRGDDELASPRSSRALVGSTRAPSSQAPPPPTPDATVPAATGQSSVSSTESSDVSTSRSTAAATSSLLSLDNSFLLNNNNNSSSHVVTDKASSRNHEENHVRCNKMPLKGSLSLDPSTLSRQHSPVLPPPLQYANVSPSSVTNSECGESPPELRRPYSVQTTPQARRVLADNEISC